MLDADGQLACDILKMTKETLGAENETLTRALEWTTENSLRKKEAHKKEMQAKDDAHRQAIQFKDVASQQAMQSKDREYKSKVEEHRRAVQSKKEEFRKVLQAKDKTHETARSWAREEVRLLLGILTIGPWALLIFYDLLLWIFRCIYYLVPFVGGRARGKKRPRAPSLAERPSGQRRTFSMSGAPFPSEGHAEKEGLRERILDTNLGDDPADIAESLALRSAQDAYRSMPGTPLGMEPRGANAVDLAAAMNHARMGLDGQDYFLGAQRFPPGAMGPRSPMPPVMGNNWNHENEHLNRSMGNMLPFQPERDRERDLEDQTRKDNRVAALLNGAILAPAKFAQVHPLRCDDGTYPADFQFPKTVEAMKILDKELRSRNFSIYGQWIGIICIFLCIALGIANIFNPPIIILFSILCLISGLVLIFVEVPLLLRICPTSEKFDVFIRRFTTNYMRAGMYGLMSLIQWLSLIRKTTSLVAAAVLLIAAAICYLIAGLKGQGFVGSKTLGGQGVAQMIV
ncbi:MAG: hypothetical protein L6R37_000574 [Teloschistes peruensis]|nr:MAG: hypothetical protein L6R37_000574 [Teloschistes peruensis]